VTGLDWDTLTGTTKALFEVNGAVAGTSAPEPISLVAANALTESVERRAVTTASGSLESIATEAVTSTMTAVIASVTTAEPSKILKQLL
jgi:hypothetical protein